jgi:hypothetical protein
LRQRPEGRWEWRTPPSFPVKKSLYAWRQEDVLKKRDEFLKDFEQGLDLDAKKLTVAEYLDLWLEEAGGPLRGALRPGRNSGLASGGAPST